MRRGWQVLGWVSVFAVVFLQRPSACRAAETTERGVTATLYGGAGDLHEPNNESFEDAYRIRRFGLGAAGALRFGSERAAPEPRGFFLALGGTFELEHSRRTACGYSCPYALEPAPSRELTDELATHFGARVGGGYSWPVFEFRLGVLTAQPDRNITYADPLWLPDAQLRFGRRSLGWFELGLGAYDASTLLRPGLYVGGAWGAPRVARVSSHFGLHLVNGLCCSTVSEVGFRGELGVEHAFSDQLRAGVSAAVLGSWVAEGSLHVAFAL